MNIVLLNWIIYRFILKLIINQEVFVSYFIFTPFNYLSFEITHLLSHSYNGSNNIIFNAKHYHKLHHITENINYSFVTPFWDYLFGTLSPKYNISFIELLFGFIPFYSFFVHDKSDFK
jgi:sterol desaturase/sphingolipid hydroxylase (fatty acid hydroxylase superfamily)